MESLDLCTHWVMEDSVTIHYTAKAFYCFTDFYMGIGVLLGTTKRFSQRPPIFRGFQRSGVLKVHEVEGGCLE